MSVYMVVTSDKYELPLAVGNAADIARFTGTKISTVYRQTCNDAGRCNGKYRGYKIIKI